MQTIHNLQLLPQKIRLALYGSGNFGVSVRKLLQIERPDIEVVCWIDSYQSGEKEGLPVHLADTLPQWQGGKIDAVLITSVYAENIQLKLSSLYSGEIFVASYGLVVIGKIQHRKSFPEDKCFKYIAIELTTTCNMRCTFCVYGKLQRSHAQIEKSLLFKILDEIALENLAPKIMFVGEGEPLLYKWLPEAVHYAKKRGLQVAICTNGLGLIPDNFEKLVTAGLDHLSISLHNLSAETFSYRKPSKFHLFSEYFSEIIRLVDTTWDRSLGAEITLSLMFSKPEWASSQLWQLDHIRNDTLRAADRFAFFLESVEKIAQTYGKQLLLKVEDLLAELEQLQENSYSQIIPLADNLSVQLVALSQLSHDAMKDFCGEKIDEFIFKRVRRTQCTNLQSPFISLDGSFFSCCAIPYSLNDFNSFSMGNIAGNVSIAEIIENHKYQGLLASMKLERDLPDYCQQCKGRYISKAEG